MINTLSHTFLVNHILEQSPDMICTLDHEGKFIYANNACEKILGFKLEYLLGKPASEFVYPADQERTIQIRKDIVSGNKTTTFENRVLSKKGEIVFISWSVVWSEQKNLLISIGRDITEQVLAKSKIQEKDALFQALIEHGSDMLALLDAEGNYNYVQGATFRSLGYEPGQLVGQNALSLIHPDDLPKVSAALEKVLTQKGHVPVAAFRLKNAAGEWRWIETIGSNQLDNPSIRAIVISSRDITEPICNKLKLIESEQRFKALFDNNPDMVHFEDLEGIILDVNPAVLTYYGAEKKDVVGKPMATFLPPDAALLCEQKKKEALTGCSVKFEQEIEIIGLEKVGPIVLEVTKIPVEIDGEITGMYTISRDITAQKHYQKTIRQQAKKLSNIFESITDAFFTTDKDWRFTYINNECERILGIDRNDNIGKNIFEVYHEEEGGVFHKQYQYAFDTGNSVHFEAFLERNNQWLEVRAFPSIEGLSVYFTDITERVRIEQELEKLSIVASKTSNGVAILDALGYTEWVNDGFTKITGYTASECIGKVPGRQFRGPKTDIAALVSMSEQLLTGLPYTGEILIYKKTGEEIWISINMTPIPDEHNNLVKYVAILTDITDMVKNRQKLKELSLVASTSTNGIFITDAERRIEWANEGFTRLTGYTASEVMVKRPSELLHNEKTASEPFKLAKEKMLRGEPVSFEAFYSTKSGDDVWVSAEVNPVEDEQGKLSRFIGIFTDITALKKSELELTQLTKDLYRHNRDMQQFTYIVSHNLRLPVANAIGLTNLINKVDKNSAAFDKSLVNLKTCVLQLDMMLKDMNTILSVKDVKETFNREEVELNQVLQQVLVSLQEPLEIGGGEVILDIPEAYTVSGNRAYLYSIFYNLLSNAIKYRSPDRALQVAISCSLGEPGETVLLFSDNGSGFDMAKVGHKLFKLYTRFHAGEAEGRGMGLFLVKTHIEALGGSIEVSSKVNIGTTFTLYFR